MQHRRATGRTGGHQDKCLVTKVPDSAKLDLKIWAVPGGFARNAAAAALRGCVLARCFIPI